MSLWHDVGCGRSDWMLHVNPELDCRLEVYVASDGLWVAYYQDNREAIGRYPTLAEAQRAAVGWLRVHLRAALDAIAGEEGSQS